MRWMGARQGDRVLTLWDLSQDSVVTRAPSLAAGVFGARLSRKARASWRRDWQKGAREVSSGRLSAGRPQVRMRGPRLWWRGIVVLDRGTVV